MSYYNEYSRELVASGILFLVLLVSRVIITKVIKRFAQLSEKLEHRTNLIIKYIHLLLNILAVIILTIIWGVQTDDIFIALSSITTVVGVAMFAQWSILSNVTSGVILFFTFPFKIGDIIKIHDKDFPIEAEIQDIGAFHVTLKSLDGEIVIYPNNLFFQKGISIVKNHDENSSEFTDKNKIKH